MVIKLGTRGSKLARTQSEQIAQLLQAQGHEVELVIVRTHGDVDRSSLRTLGGVGVFAAALRTAILSGEVDCAVHSYKDLPTAPASGLVIAAVPRREDTADVLVGATSLAGLPMGARIGTGSPRRAAQLLAKRQDIHIVDIRGNVDTRIEYVQQGELDAVVLAAAGLSRLGLWGSETQSIAGVPVGLLDIWPAAAQGALAVECRADDQELQIELSQLDDPTSRLTTIAERGVLGGLQAGCAAPVATLSQLTNNRYILSAGVWQIDGNKQVTADAMIDDWTMVTTSELSSLAENLGFSLAEQLIACGADQITDLQASITNR